MDDEPIEIAGSFPFFQHVAELHYARTAMIEHRVQHHIHPAGVRLRYKFFEVIGRAESRIYRLIVLDIVLVI